MSRGTIKSWDTLERNLEFHFVNVDGPIRVTLFEQGVDKFDTILKAGGVYSVSGVSIKFADRSVVAAASFHEIALDNKAFICE